jgi:tetratricopeptide (TPR) repeat protein
MDEPLSRVPLQELVGRQLGDYSLRRILGHGSMGVVFEAVHSKLGRRVALKVLPPGLGATEKAIQRFLREAQAVAQLSHENIVPIYEIGNEGATHFYAMQFLDGEPLDAVIRRGPLDPREAARLVCTAARAVHFAHQRGIIHRDVKPANMIRLREVERGDSADGPASGKVVLTDFGLARPEQGESITDSGAMVGTPLYMSPEQVRAKKGEIDRRTDVYSLGATLYEMVAGRPPFTGGSTQEILQRILDEEPRPPRAFATHLHEDLEVVILKALEKEPKRRYESALEFAQDLERNLEGEPILARRTTFVGRGWRRVRKQKTIAILSLVVAVISLSFAVLMKSSLSATLLREFKNARDRGDAAFGEGNHLAALQGYEDALAKREDDDARLGRARALCELAKNWERRLENGEKDVLPQIAKSLGATDVDAVYARARKDVDLVAQHRPDDALALFYRGFLRWRDKDPIVRNAGVDDLLAAGQKADKDWRTQLEFASFRLGLTANPKFPADTRSELLQQALSNASDALKVMRPLVEPGAPLPSPLFLKEMARAHCMRADIYQKLYETSGDASAYVNLCLADAKKAHAYDERNDRANQLIEWAQHQLADIERARSQPASAPAADAAATGEAPSNLSRIFGKNESSAGSELLAKMLQKGGELLASGWQQTDDFRSGVMDKFVSPYFKGETGSVPETERIEAARLAQSARDDIKRALDGGGLDDAVRTKARDKLREAVAKNPRSPQFFYELAVVEQDLKDFESARTHLTQATEIAKSNPLFFHQLALVCEQLGLTDEALAHERRTFDLAPGNPDFVAKYAALAIAAARVATPEKRAALVKEARKAAATLESIDPQHELLAPLKKALDELDGRAAPAGG